MWTLMMVTHAIETDDELKQLPFCALAHKQQTHSTSEHLAI